MLFALIVSVAAGPPAASNWNLVAKGLSHTSIGLSAVNASTVYLAGGGGHLGAASWVAVSVDGGVHWNAIPGVDETKVMLSNVVKVTPSGMRVAAGVSLFTEAAAFSASGADVMAKFEPVKKHDTFSTQDVEAAHGKVFITSEWNHWSNSSVCAAPKSPQCSGVLVADEASFPGATFDHVLWGGTDEPGVDARYGAFPTSDTWYIAGGSWPSGKSAAHAARLGRANAPRRVKAARTVGRRYGDLDGYRGLITKTTDGGKTWATVFNDTGFNATYALYFNQIACADEETCWAVGECPGNECADTQGGLYGAFIYATTDGGATWTRQHYAYEISLLKLHVLSKTHVIAAGGSVGMSFGGILLETTDGGGMWATSALKGHGYVFGIDMLPDGSVGYAVTCLLTPSSCSVWRYDGAAA